MKVITGSIKERKNVKMKMMRLRRGEVCSLIVQKLNGLYEKKMLRMTDEWRSL